jgi:hypothetical protein
MMCHLVPADDGHATLSALPPGSNQEDFMSNAPVMKCPGAE